MMDMAARDPSVDGLPVAPGESKFRIKGLAYRGIVEFMKGQGGSFEQDVRESLGAELREFCDQPFMAASWYDALPIRSFTAAVAARLGVTHEEYLRMGAAKQAALDARTVYRHLMDEQAPFEVVRRQVRIGLRYYSFLQGTYVHTGEHQGEIRAHGMPLYLASWFMPMQESYTTETLRRCGVSSPVVRAELVGQVPSPSEPLAPTKLVFKASWGQAN